MKAVNLMLSLVAVLAAAAGPAQAAYFWDDFGIDTSANYTYSDSYGSGGSFEISGGTLNITTGVSNTAAVMTTSTVGFAVGETVSLDVPPRVGGDLFLMVSTIAAQPDGTSSFGFRWRRDTVGVRTHLYPGGLGTTIPDPDNTKPATLHVKRVSDTDFEFSIEIEGVVTTVATETLAELSGITYVHIGGQVWGTSVITRSLDNLSVSGLGGLFPEPKNGAEDVCRKVVLSWTPGEYADKYDVYFGTNFDDVNEATTTVDPGGVYQGRQDPNHHPIGGTP